MKLKKVVIVLIILLLVLIIYFCIEKNKTINVPLKKFTPFSSNSLLIETNSSFIISENLPTIEGASAFYPFAANLVQTIYNEKEYEEGLVKMVSTSETFNDLISGKTDIAIVTYPSEEQKNMIDNSNVELEYIPLFKEPLAILVNKSNPISNLSIEQIQDIYYEDNLNWNIYSSFKGSINTYQLEKNNGSQTCFESIVKNNKIEYNHYEIELMPKIIDKVGKDRNGIAYAFYSYYTKMHSSKNSKIIKVNDVDINSDNYPLLFDVYLIYRTNNKNDNIQKLVEWIKSEEGENIINKIGGKK